MFAVPELSGEGMMISPFHFGSRRSFLLSGILYPALAKRSILCEKGSGTREVIDNLTTRKEMRLRSVMEIGDNEALKSSVAAGLGISIISSNVVKRDVKEGLLKVLRITDEKLYRTFFAIHHKNKYITNTIKNFLRAVAEFPMKEANAK
jgi:DNA-binding transcriptional LysR family regulator